MSDQSPSTAPSPSSFPWEKNGRGWILSAGKIVATMGGCTREDDCNARAIEAVGDMLELTQRIAKGGMSYPTYERKMAAAILHKIFQENAESIREYPVHLCTLCDHAKELELELEQSRQDRIAGAECSKRLAAKLAEFSLPDTAAQDSASK